jgi:hypothetical protein
MFCLECGTEMAIRARVCPTCGHVYGDRERSMAEPQPALGDTHASAAGAQATSPRSSSSQTAPAVKYVGEVSTTGLPRDLPGRFVLGISLGLAADLLLPWVSVNGQNVTPASLGAPVIVVVALLAAAILPVFTVSLRQHPIWSALPLIIGAFCAGIAGSVWLLLAPLTQIFAQSFGSDPSNLLLSPQGGLYLFIIGSGVLLVSGQKMLAAMHESQLTDARRDAVRALSLSRQAASVRSGAPAPAPVPASALIATNTAAAQPATPAPANASGSATPEEAAPIRPALGAPVAPVLPGTDAWHQAPAAPTSVRPAFGGGWQKTRGPHRLR